MLRAAGATDNEYFQTSLSEQCADNQYVTTLHVLSSVIVKLGKLVTAQTVYRGMSGRVLPKQFWVPNKFNVSGGVEFGFMSTTTNKEVAIGYASGRPNATVLKIAMGMIDRGADISWISQYRSRCVGLELLNSGDASR